MTGTVVSVDSGRRDRVRRARGLVAALAVLGAAAPAAAQNVGESFTPFLNASDLRDMDADGRGNLWLAGNGGALRFGLTTGEWETFPRLLGTGPRGNDLVTVCVDAAGRVWVGSASRGFTFYDPLTKTWDRESEEWPDPRIRVIRCLGGGVYIGTENGLSLKPTATRTDICAPSDPGCIVPSYIVNDYALQGDTLWVATESGLGRFNGSTWDSLGTLPPGSLGQHSRSLAVFQGRLWEVTAAPQRIRYLENGVWYSAQFPVSRLAVTGGRLYAFGGNVIYRWEGLAWLDLQVPLSGDVEIRDIEVIGQDMYLAVNGALLLWRGGPGIAQRFVPPGPKFPGTYSAMAVDGRNVLWAGTSEGTVGLVWWDGSTWQGISALEAGLNTGWILGMYRSRNETIWIGHCCCYTPTDCPLQRVEADSLVTFTDVLNAWAFAEDSGGRLWMGSRGEGVLVRDLATGVLLFDLTVLNTGGALSSNNVTAVAVTSGDTYIGTEAAGLDVWRHGGNLDQGRDGTGWIHQGESALGLLDESIEAMAFRDGELWVGTTSGLHRLRGAAVEERCPTRDRNTPGDPIRKTNALVADRLGGLWAATDGGLVHLPRGGACDAAGGDFQVFTMENSPLPADRVVSAAVSPVDGTLWFGTPAGILRVDPVAFSGSAPPPDRFVLYPNPIFPGGDSAQRRRAIFGIEKAGIRVEPVSAAISSRPRVYDLSGRFIGEFEPASGTGGGSWLWRGTNMNGDTVAPGIYVVQAEVEGETVTLRLGVVR